MLEKIKEAVEYIKNQYEVKPKFGIILGTGLGSLVNEVEVEKTIEYKDIPHFPLSTVETHSGKLIFGKLSGKQVVVMKGRFHYYEGYDMDQVTFPVRVMKLLGIEKLFISNAAGGLNPEYQVSDLMILNDHINLLPEHPLRGENINELGDRFPDMSDAYDEHLIEKALSIATEKGIRVHQGVYAAVSGPALETKAEYKYLRIIGADAVGMSTIPENIVARHMGLPCFAISVITDLGVEGKIEKVVVANIIKAAMKAEPYMTAIFKELIAAN
ncbi:MAG: purine-nucleoside phosphorylase [Cyclobacteriaceae bacterium]|nr:purine-nucleoside phosphorylase [Cyclobacteriaceae bacterium]